MSGIPTNLKVDESVLKEASKRPTLKFGWHRFVNTNAKSVVVEKGKMQGFYMLNVTTRALKDPDDPNSKDGPPMFFNIYAPIVNPDVPDMKIPPWVPNIGLDTLAAMYTDEEDYVPAAPQYDKETKEISYNGEVIEKEAQEECKLEALGVAADKMLQLLQNPNDIVEMSFWGLVGSKEGSEYVNIMRFASELPEDAVLAGELEEEDPAPAPVKPRSTKSKGKKKTKKATKKRR